MDTAQPPVPSVLAMLLCDTVITEANTNKKTLVGVFDRWNLPQLPVNVVFWLYSRLADAEGEYTFKVKIVHLEDERLLAEMGTHPVQISDRLGAFEVALPFPPIPLEKSGRYEIQLFANEVFIGRTPMDVKLPEGG